MKVIKRTLLIVGSAAVLLGAAASPRAVAAPRPGPRPTPAEVATARSFTGLETAEALLEDLNFRNLELHDREMLNKAVASRPSSGGKVVFSIDNGWPSAALHIPASSTGSAPAPVAAPKSGGAPNCADLNAYVRLLARLRPGGIVTGRFSDWRATSVYRAVAGYHNGYDIAYPPGTPIAAGWSGQVVSIANWYGAEHGITVQSPEGFRTTYGHLSPTTHVGAWVNPGDVVGRVVNDHVDVKMRAFGGGFVDFAHGVPGISGGKASAYTGPVGTASNGGRVVVTMRIQAAGPATPRVLPPLAGPAWSRRPEAVRAAIAYLRARYQEANLLMQGASAPSGTMATVRRQIEESRGRLLVNGVPEDVLLAAFVHSDSLRQGAFWFGGGLSSDAQVDVIDEESARRGDMVRTAQEALPQLQALLRDLNAQAPPRS